KAVPTGEAIPARENVADVRLERAAVKPYAARLEELVALTTDDHDDPRPPRPARRLERELGPLPEPRDQAPHLPRRLAGVVQGRRRHAAHREQRLGGALVVDQARALRRVVAEEIGVVPPVEPEHLGPQAAETGGHGCGSSPSAAGARAGGAGRTAARK